MSTIVHSCRRCGACCRWAGDVCLNDDEIGRMAEYLEMTEEMFINRYCRLRRNRRGLSLAERENGACIMLREDGRCRIQEVKPAQCADFPRKWNFPGWEQLCPGAGREDEA